MRSDSGPAPRRLVEWKVLAIRLGTRVRGLLPRPLALVIAKAIGTLCWGLLRKRRRTICSNLTRTAADRFRAERRRLCRATFQNLAVCTADFLDLPRTNAAEVLALVRYEGLDLLEAAIARGHGVILVSAHLGNPEMGGVVITSLGYRVHTVVERVRPAHLDLYNQYRSVGGLTIAPLGGAEETGRAVLSSGDVLVLVMDRVIGGREGRVVEFAGGRRMLPTGPARLALSTGAPVMVAYLLLATSPRGNRYFGAVEPEISVTNLGPDPVAELTARIAQHLGQLVRQHPDQWFVFQPDWIDDPNTKTPNMSSGPTA